MAKYQSKAGVQLNDVYVVTPEEKKLTATIATGQHENLVTGDALVKRNGNTYVIRADLFSELFEPQAE